MRVLTLSLFVLLVLTQLVDRVTCSDRYKDLRRKLLNVSFSQVGNTLITITIKNVADFPMRLLREGTIFDEAPVQHFRVSLGRDLLPFKGYRKIVIPALVDLNVATTYLRAGESYRVTVDASLEYDLTPGDYRIFSFGSVVYGSLSSHLLRDQAQYRSSPFVLRVRQNFAANSPRAEESDPASISLAKRALVVKDTCTVSEHLAITGALLHCYDLATAGSRETGNRNSPRMRIFYKSDSVLVRSFIKGKLRRLRKECVGLANKLNLRCSPADFDFHGFQYSCKPWTAMISSGSEILFCPAFFNDLPNLEQRCYFKDRGLYIVRELTMQPDTFGDVPTWNFETEWPHVNLLDLNMAAANADTYAFFTQSALLNC